MPNAHEIEDGNPPSTFSASARRSLLVICFFAFISMGMPDGLLGVAWPGVRQTFGLSIDALGPVMIVGTIGYVLTSFYCGWLTRRLGIGWLLSLSCFATALSLWVVASSPWWSLIVAIAFVLGSGAGAIDSALNTYVAKHHEARAMQWLHACFGIGITMGPMIMTAGISFRGQWQIGYFVVGAAQLLLALAFFLHRRRWDQVRIDAQASHPEAVDAPMSESLREGRVLLSMSLFLLYVGLEIGLGLWAYSFLTEARGVAPGIAGITTGSYWAMFTLGRMIAGWYARHVTVRRILQISLGLAAVGLLCLLVDQGPVLAVVGFGLTGFAIAPVFPALVSDTEKRVGLSHHTNTIGMQMAATGVGAAGVPALVGVLARFWGIGILPGFMLSALALLVICLWLFTRISRQLSG